MAHRRRASCPCPGEGSKPEYDTNYSKLVENTQRRYTYTPGEVMYTPSTKTYSRELDLSTPGTPRVGTPPLDWAPRRTQRPAQNPGRRPARPKLNVRVLAREFEQTVPPEEQGQQPRPRNRLSSRWRNEAASTVDDFREQREVIQSPRQEVLQPSGRPRLGSPVMSSTPTEAYLATRARVGPPLVGERYGIPEISPIPRGSVVKETVTQVRQSSQAPERQEVFETETISREQRQVAFDVPPEKGKSRKAKKESALSPLKRFDRDATAELKKRRQLGTERGMAVLQETSGYEGTRQRSGRHPRSTISMLAKSSVSAREIGWLLRDSPDTELIEAVDKLAQAEAAVVYDGAVRAAEEAAAKAPPELAEEAAAAGARSYRAEITHSVQEILAGEKPIEIVAYVGMTRPREL